MRPPVGGAASAAGAAEGGAVGGAAAAAGGAEGSPAAASCGAARRGSSAAALPPHSACDACGITARAFVGDAVGVGGGAPNGSVAPTGALIGARFAAYSALVLLGVTPASPC